MPEATRHMSAVAVNRRSGSVGKGLLLTFAVLMIVGCSGRSREDNIVIAELEREYGERYEFDTAIGEYFQVKAKEDIDDNEVTNIYRKFFFIQDTTGEYRKTGFIWLNVYDRTGRFVYQLGYDETRGEFTRGKQEFH